MGQIFDSLGETEQRLIERATRVRLEASIAAAGKKHHSIDAGRAMEIMQGDLARLITLFPDIAQPLRLLTDDAITEGPHDLREWAQSKATEIVALERFISDQKLRGATVREKCTSAVPTM